MCIRDSVIESAKTVIWNGPMGVFEFPAFAKGTAAVAEACAKCQGTTIIGGGDSASAVKKLGLSLIHTYGGILPYENPHPSHRYPSG